MSESIIKKKTIQCTLSVTAGITNFEICEFVEQILRSSPLNSHIYRLEIQETKVIKTEDL